MSENRATDTPAAAPILEAAGLCKFYGPREVLHAVDLTLHAGEILTVIGPNGAGKTTLLRCLLGLESADRGQITRVAGLRIGYVPQQFTPPPLMPLSARRFVELSAPWDATLAAALQLDGLAQQSLPLLSGGELRRLLLLRAVATRPGLLVLDEPTAGVDISGQNALYGWLKDWRERYGFAVLIVSHDLHVVMAGSERVICLNHHICCAGSPQEIRHHSILAELFGAGAASQLALYAHHHTHEHGIGEPHFTHAHPPHSHD